MSYLVSVNNRPRRISVFFLIKFIKKNLVVSVLYINIYLQFSDEFIPIQVLKNGFFKMTEAFDVALGVDACPKITIFILRWCRVTQMI